MSTTTISGTAVTAAAGGYGTVNGVESYVPTIGNIGAATVPTSAQVIAWLEDGSAIIDRTLATAGYATPVTSSSANYNELVGLANLYAAARTLQSRALETITSDVPARWQAMLDEFYARLTAIAGSTLTGIASSDAGAGATPRRVRTFQVIRVDRQTSAGSEYGAIDG